MCCVCSLTDSLFKYSMFFVAQALTTLHWNRLSDHVGRKPIILTGLFGISISMFLFGLSNTFGGLVLRFERLVIQCWCFIIILCSRVLCGALNGNGGVVKSTMIDITDTTNLPQAFGLVPLPWMTGNTLGYVRYFNLFILVLIFSEWLARPLIGGSLSHPADRFPRLFGQSTFLKAHPYFLACASPALFTALAWLVTYMLLQEVK